METLRVIRTVQELEELEVAIKNIDFISFDTETTGLSKDSEIIGYSVCWGMEEAYYVIVAEWDVSESKLKYLETKDRSKSFLSNLVGKNLIMHNGLFDCWKVETNFSVQLMPSLHTDTMLLAHLLDENRPVGLKELGVTLFGEDAVKEQALMKASVAKNGGMLTRDNYELYKADSELIAKYGAKDTLLTLKLFYHLVPELYSQNLDSFFYAEETMPLLRSATYELNTTGLRVEAAALQKLKGVLEAECMEALSYIRAEIADLVKDKYPGTKKTNTFNIGSPKQLSWLLFSRLGNEFSTLTKGGKEACRALGLKLPYSAAAKREFISVCSQRKGDVYDKGSWDFKKKKVSRPKKLNDPWHYIASDKNTLGKLASKYKWVEKYLAYTKNLKLLNTYVHGLETRISYGIIRPSFLQHGTTSGRYSSRNPNFQNLPKGDKRIKSCIVPRPGKSFVGADYSQLEPRVFASFSKDFRLMKCFSDGDDFYSIIGAEVFNKVGLSMKKDDKDSFAMKYPNLRDISKVVALSATYGTTAFKMAPAISKNVEETREVIEKYFETFPSVKEFMLERHASVKKNGFVTSLFGRPRRLPAALEIEKLYGDVDHGQLEYTVRTVLNLAVNHTIQSTGASIVNRASIKFCQLIKEHNIEQCYIVMQVHDEIIVECLDKDTEIVAKLLKLSMEQAVKLPGVDLIAEPKIGKNLAALK